LLWGGKSVGKTGALLKKAAEWENKGHPVIEVDLKGFEGTLAAFADLLQRATISALKRHQRALPEEFFKRALEDQNVRVLRAASKELAIKAHVASGTFGFLWESLPRVTLALLKSLNPFAKRGPSGKIFEPAIATGAVVGPWFQSLASYIHVRMQKPKAADFVAIFDLLEEIALLQGSPTFLQKIGIKPTEAMKPPIVIIREIQRLDDLSDAPELGREIFTSLFNYFEPRKQGQSHVPVIIETSDFLWSRLKHILSSFEAFKAKQMGTWKREEAEEWLVKCTLDGQPAPVFTQQEFNKVC
jgi:hypothetical protein